MTTKKRKPTSTPRATRKPGMISPYTLKAIHDAISPSFSPFVQYGVVMQSEWSVSGAVAAGRLTPEEGARQVAERINRQIDTSLVDNPGLRRRYEEAIAIQARIETYRAEGRPVPAAWVTNPYHQRIYRMNGWLE